VVVVDDSWIRGTTSGKIVKMLHDVPAHEVHLRITRRDQTSVLLCLDTPTRSELVTASHAIDETAAT
jgi:amidophosphoribosyltransferase